MTTAIRVPFDIGPTGRIGRADGDYDVANQYLKNLLLTRFTERIMRPTYGSTVRDNVFESINDLTMQTLDSDIRSSVRDWEPSVDIHKVDFEDRGSVMEVEILYTLGSTIGLPPATLSVSIDVGGTVEEMS